MDALIKQNDPVDDFLIRAEPLMANERDFIDLGKVALSMQWTWIPASDKPGDNR